MNLGDFAALWSPRQNAFHVETIKEMLEANHRIFANGFSADYIVLGFADTHENALDLLKPFMDKRSEQDDLKV